MVRIFTRMPSRVPSISARVPGVASAAANATPGYSLASLRDALDAALRINTQNGYREIS